MIITLISYNNDSVKVVFEDGQALLLPVKLEVISGLSKNKELSEGEFQALKKESDLYLCQRKALSYLARSNKSAFEVSRYLRKKEFEKKLIEKVIAWLKGQNYLNDYDFALKFIDYKKRTRVVGANYLKNELIKKGLDKKIIDTALLETGVVEDNIDEILIIARKKMNLIEGKKNRMQKLLYFLQSRGFKISSIYKTIEKLKDEGFSFIDNKLNKSDED